MVSVYATDGLGSVRSGTDTQTYGTDAFGIANPVLTQGRSTQPIQYAGEERDNDPGLLNLRARVYVPSLGRFLQADPLRKSGPGVGGWNRYAYAGNNPTSAVDPSGLRTYFIPGIGGSDWLGYGQFVTYLQHFGIREVIGPLPAYDQYSPPENAALVAIRSAFPDSDADARTVKARVLQDLQRRPLDPGEQLNLIGYSGGATTAFNAAALLEQSGIPVDNLVTIGGVSFRGKPGSVVRWTDIHGTRDYVAYITALPDQREHIIGADHLNYFSDYRDALVSAIQSAGVR